MQIWNIKYCEKDLFIKKNIVKKDLDVVFNNEKTIPFFVMDLRPCQFQASLQIHEPKNHQNTSN